ncbi:MAG TPA: TrmH family RNA methyltransferase [Polyangiaceae bacterium]|nr:TrmH family RNA methyltransferase [Polyangiaceae bacterium]
MALVPPIDLPPEQVRALLEPLRNRFSVAIYNCQNAFAVGAIIRVAHSYLAREIIIIGEAPWYEKASMGMQRYENLVPLASDDAFFAHAANRPIWSIEKDHATIALYDVPSYPDDVILVFGSERAGLPESILRRSRAVVGIPMYGVNHSFPVAVASGIVMSDWARRRYASGTTIPGPLRSEER